MAYTKQTWADGTTGNTPITAERLNHMEDGIKAANDEVEELRDSVYQILEDGSNQTHTISGVGIARYGDVVEIHALVTCAYEKSDSDYKDLLKDSRIPDPKHGGYVYEQFGIGEIAVDAGVIRIGGKVAAGLSQRIHVVYIAV